MSTRLIGRKGESLHQLERLCGTSISVEKQGHPLRQVTVTGPGDALEVRFSAVSHSPPMLLPHMRHAHLGISMSGSCTCVRPFSYR
tara:strand:- start:193 stop:450 length:258 start_codon:yes stop_codon:yes gene_type:complete